MSGGRAALARAWWAAVIALTLLGVALTPFTGGWIAVAPAFIALGGWTLIASALVRLAHSRHPRRTALVLRDGLCGGCAALAVHSWAVLLQEGVLLVLLALVVSCPLVVRRIGRGRAIGGLVPAVAGHDGVDPGCPPLVLLASPRRVAEMDTVRIGAAWRSSGRTLAAAVGLRQRAELVQLRQLYLDELHRRDAAALRLWLDSGPGASSDPTQHFERGAPGP